MPEAARGVGLGAAVDQLSLGRVVDHGLGDGMLVGAPAAGDHEPAVDEGTRRLLPRLREVGDRDPLVGLVVVAEGVAHRLVLASRCSRRRSRPSRPGCRPRCPAPGTGTPRGRATRRSRPRALQARGRQFASRRDPGAARPPSAPAGPRCARGRGRSRGRGGGCALDLLERERGRAVPGVDQRDARGRRLSLVQLHADRPWCCSEPAGRQGQVDVRDVPRFDQGPRRGVGVLGLRCRDLVLTRSRHQPVEAVRQAWVVGRWRCS